MSTKTISHQVVLQICPMHFLPKSKIWITKPLGIRDTINGSKTHSSTIINSDDRIKALENIMLENIPSVEDDIVVIYASVEGKDQNGRLRRKENHTRSFRPM